MTIYQWNVRVEIPEGTSLPSGFDFEIFAEDLFKYVHGTLIPKHEIVAFDMYNSKPFRYEHHCSTRMDACPGCIQTAQDGEC
jgi:hypothetical protein